MNPIQKFKKEREENINKLGKSDQAKEMGIDFILNAAQIGNYTYNFSWLGVPIIQFPQDMIALQEVIWQVKPDLIIEMGIAHGGSLIFSASILELLGGEGEVLGVDIDIRDHNRTEIEKHPMFKRITMIEGSSIDNAIINQVREFAKGKEKVLVILDSNHTHEHVLGELNGYADLVSVGSYCIVYDTVIEDMPSDYEWKGRDWGKGNNPKTAVWKFLEENKDFEIDKSIQDKLLITVAPDGYLKRIK